MKRLKDNSQAIFGGTLIFLVLLCGSLSVFPQSKWALEDDGCGNVKFSGRNPYGATENGAFDLQIKEQTLTEPVKKLSIDAGKNGGIRIKGWNRREIYIKACVQSWGKDETEAKRRVFDVKIETANGDIRAFSPNAVEDSYFFGVSYDVRVPVDTDLILTTNNGGINIAGVRGLLEFNLNNGGAILNEVAGTVRGKTKNGNLTFNLTGEKWDGEGIDVQTNNGGIYLNIPSNYSAQIQTLTQRGKFYANFPVENLRADRDKLGFNLGTNGALIKFSTANGSINIKQRGEITTEKKL